MDYFLICFVMFGLSMWAGVLALHYKNQNQAKIQLTCAVAYLVLMYFT